MALEAAQAPLVEESATAMGIVGTTTALEEQVWATALAMDSEALAMGLEAQEDSAALVDLPQSQSWSQIPELEALAMAWVDPVLVEMGMDWEAQDQAMGAMATATATATVSEDQDWVAKIAMMAPARAVMDLGMELVASAMEQAMV